MTESMFPRAHAPRRTRPRVLLLALQTLLLAGIFAACGSSGDAPPPPTTVVIDLGVVSATLESRLLHTFQNPLSEAATVTEVGNSGTFEADAFDLPAVVPGGQSLEIGLLLVRPNQGPRAGSITLRYMGAVETREVTYHFRATGEPVPWLLTPATLDFGTVDVGMSADLSVAFRNGSTMSPVTLTGARFSSADLSVVGTPFPLTLQPGEEGMVDIRFAPTVGGRQDGRADLGALDLGGPVAIPVRAAAPGEAAEVVTDFGTQAFLGDDTGQIAVDVPADAISLTLEGHAALGTQLGLGELIGPDGTVYENTALTGEYIWLPGSEVFSTSVPNTDRANVQLVAGGGTYLFRIRRMSGSAPSVAVRTIVERRTPPGLGQGVLDLNVWLADGITPTAATAGASARLQAILDRVDDILAGQGIRLGSIHYYDVPNPDFDEITSDAEFATLLLTTSGATAVRLNLFFVEVALGGSVVGAAATVAGPKRNGTTLSGVMSIYEGGQSPNTIGLIAAHEVGHFLGLFHTVEMTGSHDFIDDTADCPPTGTSGACPIPGGGLLMHWRALGGIDLTNGQGLVIRGHPLVGPIAGGSPKPAPGRRAEPLTAEDLAAIAALPPGWCSHCRPPPRKGAQAGR